LQYEIRELEIAMRFQPDKSLADCIRNVLVREIRANQQAVEDECCPFPDAVLCHPGQRDSGGYRSRVSVMRCVALRRNLVSSKLVTLFDVTCILSPSPYEVIVA
jgi:hypothetical protein